MKTGRALAVMLSAVAIAGAHGNAGAQTYAQAAGPVVISLQVDPKPQITETPMIFAVSDSSGEPIATEKATGRAEFSSGGLRGIATLHPDGANRMKAYGLMSAKPDLRITVSITLPGAAAVTATFNPQQPAIAGKP